MLSSSPRNLGFEASPFKLTPELVEVMGGETSDMFAYFKILLLQGMLAARKHHEKIISLVEVMSSGGWLALCHNYLTLFMLTSLISPTPYQPSSHQ